MSIKSRLFTVVLLFKMATAYSQLDTIHWLPPMHARAEWGPQYLYLSTPEVLPFLVEVRDGAGNLITSAIISNSQPFRYFVGSDDQTPVMADELSLHKPLKAKGLVISGPKQFYAYFRAHSASQFHAGDLTCKGRAALGKIFRIGHLLQEPDNNARRSNFIGVMATEDSTVISLSDYEAGTQFRVGGADIAFTAPVTMTLQKGECAVFSQYLFGTGSSQPANGFMGTLLEASKPVAVNCGSWLGAPVTSMANDIGIDQIAPLEKMGKEYILCKGNGSSVLEHPIIIAHTDNTQIWLNGSISPTTTLSAGGYYVVSTGSYTVDGNMYILASAPVFVYQMIGGAPTGDDALRTAGLIFVPPISCGIPNAVDNIYQPNLIGNMQFQGGLMITAMRDSLVTVRVDGVPVSIGAAASVPGIPDFVTYRKLDLFNLSSTPSSVSIRAQGAVQVAMYGRNEPASFAAFYSGFTKTITAGVKLHLTGDGVCPDTLIARGKYDGIQWFYGDSLLHFGADTFLTVYTPGQYIANAYLGVCRRTDFAADTIDALFTSPAFQYAVQEPSCYGYSNGQIHIDMPYGGLAPYSYSVDGGHNYTQNPDFEMVKAGDYSIVVRDSTGCYNRPLELSIAQPDSFTVHLTATNLSEFVDAGQPFPVYASANHLTSATEWTPHDSLTCANCLTYTFSPEENTEIVLIAVDTAGCVATDRLQVKVFPRLFAPNVFNPASSVGNDYFTLFSRDDLPIKRLDIFDRWGNLMFRKTDFTSNYPSAGWDGRFKGEPVLPGVYVFQALVEIDPGRVIRMKGDVLVVR
ncbi:MAG: gliding motility-associated C-terminal domain-containing protein [Bacteroidota bacterium]